jgi:hypothetical protein
MSLSSEEAAAHLSQAESAGRRSAQLYSYRRTSPHLIMWGAIWVIGYGVCDFFPHYGNATWIGLILAGVIGGIFFGRRCASKTGGPRAWRMIGLAVLAVFFVAATYTIMWPVHGAQVATYPALITGTVYAGVGLWAGLRYVVTGIMVIALTLGGFFWVHEHLLLWMAFVGGGSMMLAGLWFRAV